MANRQRCVHWVGSNLSKYILNSVDSPICCVRLSASVVCSIILFIEGFCKVVCGQAQQRREFNLYALGRLRGVPAVVGCPRWVPSRGGSMGSPGYWTWRSIGARALLPSWSGLLFCRVGIKILSFFFLCGHWAPPSAKMPWGYLSGKKELYTR